MIQLKDALILLNIGETGSKPTVYIICYYHCIHSILLPPGEDTFQCEATGCWEPNALPKCIDKDLISSWGGEGGPGSGAVSL